MSDLTAFLLARLAEDTADAREVQALAVTRGIQPDDPREPSLRVAARVLAQVGALRAVVEDYEDTLRRCEENSEKHTRVSSTAPIDYERLTSLRTHGWELRGRKVAFEATLRALAQVWASHPAFDPAWEVGA